MRHLLLGSVAAGALLGAAVPPARAADLPARAPAATYTPAFTWTGFYIGANAGVAWRDLNDDVRDALWDVGYPRLNPPVAINNFGFGCGVFCNDAGGAGFTGGLTLGANWQHQSWVLGVEGDLNAVDLNDDNAASTVSFSLPRRKDRAEAGIPAGPLSLGPRGNPYTATLLGDDGGDSWFATARLRVGYAWDRVLFYATGGVAYHDNRGDNGHLVVVRNAAGAIPTTFNGTPAIFGGAGDDGSGLGWAAGAGLEWAITPAVSAKLEYLHAGFGGGDSSYVDPVLTTYFGTPVVFGSAGRDIDVVRAGVNVRFGDPVGPTIASLLAQDDDDRPAARGRTAGRRQGAADDDDKGKGGERKEGVETEDIFGFTEGTDTGEAGEKELSSDLLGRFGKRRAVRIIEQRGGEDEGLSRDRQEEDEEVSKDRRERFGNRRAEDETLSNEQQAKGKGRFKRRGRFGKRRAVQTTEQGAENGELPDEQQGEEEPAEERRERSGKRRDVRVIKQRAEAELPPLPVVLAPRSAYVAFNNVTELEYSITDSLKFALGVASAYYYVRDVFESENRNIGGFDGLSAELKWRLLERGPSPIGLAVAVEPEWRRFEETSGAPATVVSVGLKLQADAALIPDVLFAALNLTYEPEASKQRGRGRFEIEADEGTVSFEPFRWERESNLEASGALSGRVTENIFVGAELRYLTKYEGLFFREFEGRALFVGPTFFAKLSERAFVKAAWSVQVAGKAAEDPGSDLDLVNYERHQVRVKFGFNF